MKYTHQMHTAHEYRILTSIFVMPESRMHSIKVQHFEGQNRKLFLGPQTPSQLERGIPLPRPQSHRRLHSSTPSTHNFWQVYTYESLWRVPVLCNAAYVHLAYAYFLFQLRADQWRCAQGPPKPSYATNSSVAFWKRFLFAFAFVL